MTEQPRQIAIVKAEQGYDGLHQAFRARADELRIARDQIDELASLTRGHASKLLAPYPMRAIGRTTLGPLLYALKLKIVLVPDDDVIWSAEPAARNEAQTRGTKPLRMGLGNLPESRFLSKQLLSKALQKCGKKGGKRSAALRARKSPQERSEIARKAWRTKRRIRREKLLATRCAPGETTIPASRP